MIWTPNKRQEDFIALPDSIFEALYGGAAWGGKSEVLLMLPIIRKFIEHPKFKGLILRRTYPELEKEIILRSEDYYPHFGGKYDRENKRWRFRSGAIVQFGHAEYEQDIRKYDSSEYNYIAFDECTSFTPFQYLYLSFSRCRSKSKDLPAIVRSATNPGNISHKFFRKRFVEPCSTGYKIILDAETKTKRIFVPAKATDNTVGLANDPGYIDRMGALPEAERRAKRDGDWWTYEGQVFSEFRENHFSDEPENALHVIPPFEIPEWWPRILAVDWGYAAMAYGLWGAVSPRGRCFLYREHARTRTKISVWAHDMADLSVGEPIVDVVLDPSAWGHRGDEKTIMEQFAEASGFNPRKADNDRISGKILIHEFLRWAPKDNKEQYDNELAQRILRHMGYEKYKDYLKDCNREQENASDLPRIQIFSPLKELRSAVSSCVYAEPDKDGKPSEDVAEFAGDDPYDTLRYLLKAVDYYVERCKREQVSREMLDKASEQLRSSGDWTRFYRQMERIEAKTPRNDAVRFQHFRRTASSYLRSPIGR